MPEVRRLLLALVDPPERFSFRLEWSRFRRRHQARAQQSRAARLASSRFSPTPTVSSSAPCPASPPLSDAQWASVASLLHPAYSGVGRPPHDQRTMLEGMLWVVGRGASWRELPEQFGKWEAVYRRYRKWRDEGIWQRILDRLAGDDKA